MSRILWFRWWLDQISYLHLSTARLGLWIVTVFGVVLGIFFANPLVAIIAYFVGAFFESFYLDSDGEWMLYPSGVCLGYLIGGVFHLLLLVM